MQKQTLLTLSFVFLFVFTGFAEQQKSRNFYVMGVPQYLLYHGLRLEGDFTLNENSNQWLTIAPTIYYRNYVHRFYWEFDNVRADQLTGLGMEVYYRRFLTPDSPHNGFYVSGGGGYRYLSLKALDMVWEETPINDLTYFTSGHSSIRSNVHAAIVRTTLGYQFDFFDGFTMDLYLGVSFRYRQYTDASNTDHIHISNFLPLDLSGNGFMIAGGIRLGLGW